MPEIEDLSGPLNQHLKFEDFSKGALLRLIGAWQFAWLQQTEAWYSVLKERLGSEVADACELAAWLQLEQRVGKRYAQAANIQLNTVEDSLKLLQVRLDNTTGGFYEQYYEFKTPNHVIWTTHRCCSLEYFEKKAPERIVPVCHVLEPAVIAKALNNPRIKVTALKLPPRKSPQEFPCCQWELKIEE